MNQGTGSIRIRPVLILSVIEAYVGFVDFCVFRLPKTPLALTSARKYTWSIRTVGTDKFVDVR
jgi:hypothetical protein